MFDNDTMREITRKIDNKYLPLLEKCETDEEISTLWTQRFNEINRIENDIELRASKSNANEKPQTHTARFAGL